MATQEGLTRRGLIIGGITLTAAAQLSHAANAELTLKEPLVGLKRLLGRWRGEGDGEPGRSRVERHYESALGGHFVMVRNTSTYAPQKKNPTGEVHDDVGFFSFDKARRRAVFRQFHTEGFVNQYVASAAELGGDVLIFESEAIENIAAGWRARETYRFSGADAFEELFELAEPGKEFATYSRAKLRRA
jgi:nitrobindin-like protein